MQIIDEYAARSLYKQNSARGWNKNEPVEVPNESAAWLARALDHFDGAGEDWQSAVSATGLDRRHLSRWTDWSPTQAPAEVIDLGRVRRMRGSRRHG